MENALENTMTTPEFNDMCDEVIVSILGYLYAYQLYNLSCVNKRFKKIIVTYFFKYKFNPDYTSTMKLYINKYWASITKPLTTLQSPSSLADYIYSDQNFVSAKQDSQQTEGRTSLTTIENGEQIFLKKSKFKECFRQLNLLLRHDILSYIILNEMNTDFFNLVMNMAMSPRGTDGLYARLKNDHYSFPNLFGYFVAQVIFGLVDGIIPLEKRLKNYPDSFLSSKVTRESRSIKYKQAGIYCVHIPRNMIFAATCQIDYYRFFSIWSQSDKKKLTRMLVTAQSYIDVCRECEGLRDPPPFSVFDNQSFTVKKTTYSSLYFEMSDTIRIVRSGASLSDEEDFSSSDNDLSDDDPDGM